MTTPWSQEYAWAFYSAACILWLIAGVGLFIALLRDRARGRRRCPKCWYDMAGVPGLKCPECGREARKERRLHSTRRRWRLATLFALLAALGLACFRAPVALRNGVGAAIPIPILNFALSWFPEDAKAAYESMRSQLWTNRNSLPRIPTPPRPNWTDGEELLAAWYAGCLMSEAPDRETAWEAMSVLGYLGINGRPAVPWLIECGMRDPLAVSELRDLADAGATEAMIGLDQIAMRSGNATSRLSAFEDYLAIRSQPAKRVSMLRRYMARAPDGGVRRKSARELAKMAALSQSEMAAELHGDDEWIRCGLIEGLAPRGNHNRWLLPELLCGVDGKYGLMTQIISLRCLPEFGPLGEEWAPPLIRVLNEASGEMRASAIIAAARLEASLLPQDVTNALSQTLTGASQPAAAEAARTVLIRAESFDHATLNVAFERLEPEDRMLFQSIARMWQPPAIAAALASDMPALRRAALKCQMERGVTKEVPVEAMLRAFRIEGDSVVRAECASFLGLLPADSTITPALVQAGLHDADSSVRAVALRAAESRRDADTQLVAALIESLNDPSSEVVLAAANSLSRLGPRASAANDALQAAANHPDATARSAIADAIKKTKPSAAP